MNLRSTKKIPNRIDNSISSLHNAIRKKDIGKLKYLLTNNKYIDVDEELEDGSIALHLAVEIGNNDIVEALLESGADTYLKDGDGKNSLHLAAELGHDELIGLLLSRGMEINVLSKGKQTALHLAVENKKIHTVKLLLKNKAEINTRDLSGDTPLHDAVKTKSINLIKLLLIHGADPNCKNNAGETAFHSIFSNHVDSLLSEFLQHGADLQIKNASDETVLHLACKFSDEETVKKLLGMNLKSDARTSSGWTLLHCAAINARHGEAVARLLLQGSGALFDAKDNSGKTAFMVATEESGCTCEPLRYLVSMGAKLSKVGAKKVLYRVIQSKCQHSGRDILIELQNRGLVDIVDLLREKCRGQCPALHTAVKYHDNALLDLLISKKALIKRYKYDRNLLKTTLRSKNVYALNNLLKSGLRPKNSSYRVSVLEDACSEELVKILLYYNNTFDTVDLIYALDKVKDMGVLRLLLENGADVNASDDDSSNNRFNDKLGDQSDGSSDCDVPISVLRQAVRRGNTKALRYLLYTDVSDYEFNVTFKEWAKMQIEFRFEGGAEDFTLTRIMMQHITLLEELGYHIDGKCMRLIRSMDELHELYKSCHQELKAMRATKVCREASVTWYDLLTKRGNAITHYLRHEKVRLIVERGHYLEQTFPMYADRIKMNSSEGLRRIRLVKEFQISMDRALGGLLPDEVLYMISKLLSNIHMEKCIFSLA